MANKISGSQYSYSANQNLSKQKKKKKDETGTQTGSGQSSSYRKPDTRGSQYSTRQAGSQPYVNNSRSSQAQSTSRNTDAYRRSAEETTDRLSRKYGTNQRYSQQYLDQRRKTTEQNKAEAAQRRNQQGQTALRMAETKLEAERDNAVSKTIRGTLKADVAGGHLTAFGKGMTDNTMYTQYKNALDHELNIGKISQKEYDEQLKQLQGSKAYEYYLNDQNAAHREAGKWMTQKGESLIQSGQKEKQEALEGQSAPAKWALGALSSGIGMTSDQLAGPLWALSMYSRSYGGALGEAKALGADEIQDQWNAAATGGTEAASEYMFQGIGLPSKLTKGKSIVPSSGRIIDYMLRGSTGKKAEMLGRIAKIGFGIGEEEMEELAAWGLQPAISNLIYGNQLQQLKDNEVRSTMQQYRDSVISQFASLNPDEANYFVSQMSSGEYTAGIKQNLIDSGVTSEEADTISQKMTEYAQATLTGDYDRARELEDELVRMMAPQVRKEYDYNELLDTMMSTMLMVGVTGTPGVMQTSQTGAALKQNLGVEGVRQLVETSVNTFENGESAARAQAMLDRINSGEELTDTQAFDLADMAFENYKEESKRMDAKQDLVSKRLTDENLLPATGVDQNGQVRYNPITQEAIDRDIEAIEEITNRIAPEEASTEQTAEQATEETAEQNASMQVQETTTPNQRAAQSIAAWNNGGFTVADANEIISNDVAKAAFKEFTGTDLTKFTVKNRDGTVNMAKTNAALKDYLFTTAVENEVKSAQAETANWMDVTRGQIVKQAQRSVSGTGTRTLNDVFEGYDERDPVAFMTAVNAATTMYQMGKSIGTEWDTVSADAQALFPGVSAETLQKMYEAGKYDREAAEDKAARLDVQIGEKVSQAAESDRVATGEAFDRTEGQIVKGSTLQAFTEIAHNLNINIYLVDSIIDDDGVEHTNFNGMYIDGAIYLNANETAERNVGYIFMHEVTHHLKKYAPKEYEALTNAVRERWMKVDSAGMMARIKAVQDNYKKQTGQKLTDDQALEEIICDSAHEFLMDENFAKEVSEENPSIAKSVLDGIRRGLQKIREIFATTRESDPMIRQALFSRLDMLDEAEHLWMEAYRAAVKHRAAVGIMEWDRVASMSVSPETTQRDADYMSAVESGDMETAQRMVDEAAIRNGYDLKAYHGTDSEPFNVFNREYISHGRMHGDGFYFSPYEDYASKYGKNISAYYLKTNGLTENELGENIFAATDYKDFYNVDEAKNFYREKVQQFKKYGQGIERYRPESKPIAGGHRVTFTTVGAFENGIIMVATEPEYIKSADPVTYDDNGNVVPLSQRFNDTSRDIRYSVPEYTPEEMNEHRDSLIERQQEYYDDPFTDYYGETGYIFPDGKMLRMGMYGERADDHAIATWVYDDVDYSNYQSPKAEAQKRFINEGNIRYLPESGSLEFGTKIEPTDDQYDWIERMVDDMGVGIVEFTDTNNNTVAYRDYQQNGEYPDGYEVVQDIKRFYRTGSLGTPVNQFRYSVSSTAEAVGMTFSKENGVVVLRDDYGVKIEEVTTEMIKASPIGRLLNHSMENGVITDKDVEQQIKFMTDLMNMILRTNDIELIWAISGSIGYNPSTSILNLTEDETKEKKGKFAAFTSNSDPQYSTTIDFTTICVKTQAIIDAMSESMKRMGRGLSEHEIIDIVYNEVYKAKEQVPCPVCYVFSRWVGLGGVFNDIKKFQKDYPEDMDMSEIKKTYNTLKKEVDKLAAAAGIRGTDARDRLYKQCIDAHDELEFKKYMSNTPEGKKAGNVFTEEDAAKLEDINKKLDVLDHWSWLYRTRLRSDYKAIPDDILFDINAGRTFAEEYPAVWNYRTTRGASFGKAAAPYTPERLGDVIKGVSAPSSSSVGKIGKSNRVFLSKNKENADKLTKSAQKTFGKAILNAMKQNLLNGQRLQSTSDWRFEYGLDYLLAFIELEAIGAKAQMYTKVPGAVRFLASCKAEVNCSIMAKGDGVRWNEQTGEWELEFSDVTGMSWADALALSKTFDNVQPILVAIGRQHLISAMASDDITMIIPYHSSGSSEARYLSMMRTVEETVKNRVDFKDYEHEHLMANATDEQKLCRALRTGILTGKKKTLTKAESEALANNEILRQLYIRFYGKDENGEPAKPDPKYVERFDEDGNDADCYHVFLSPSQAESIMSHEYWDKHSTRATADEQGKAYANYCRSMGLTPVFSGWDAKGQYKEDMDFTGYPGYWKTLIDRCMYNNDGTYHRQSAVNVSNVDLSMLDESQMNKEVKNPLKVNDPSKTAGIVENVLNRISEETGEKFSIPEQRDAEYMDAVNRGDMDEAQRMVDEAARREGYSVKAYHGTPNGGFTVFDSNQSYIADKPTGFNYFTDNLDIVRKYYAVDNSRSPGRKEIYSTFLKMNNPLNIDANGAGWNQIPLPAELQNKGIHKYRSYETNEMIERDTASTDQIARYAERNGYDAVVFRNVRDGSTDEEPSTVYAVMDSEQIKSADPVTYDDNDNVVPLSERFNTTSPDIRFSVPEEGEVEDHVMQTAEKLEDIPLRDSKLEEGRVRLFRSADTFVKKITGDWNEEYIKQGLVLNENTIEKNLLAMMRQVMKDSETGRKYRTGTLNETKQSAQKMYYMMKSGNEEGFAREAWDAARRIVDDIDYNDELYKKYRSLTEYLNKQNIAIPEGMEYDSEFAEFIRDNAGRMRLLSEGANVEDVYPHMRKAWPELFPEDVDHPIDQLLQIDYALDYIQPYREAYTSEEYTALVERVATSLSDIVREGQAYQSVEEEEFSRKTAAMKARHRESLKRVRERERAKKARETARANMWKQRYNERVKEDREREDRRVDMWKQRYNERVQKDIEDRAARSERALHRASFKRINKNVKWLSERLLSPTKDKNIPQQYRTDLANLLEAFDLQTVGSKRLEEKTGHVAKNTIKLEALRQAYRNIAENDESKLFSYDDGLYFSMGILAKRIDGKTIDALDITELEAVDKTLRAICYQFRIYQKIRVANKAMEISEISGRIIQDMNAKVERDGIARTKGAIDTIVNFAELTPVYFFERLGAMNDMYKELRRAFDKYIENEAHIINRLEGILGPYYNRRKNGDRWVGSEAESWRDDRSAITFELTHGTVTMTAAQRMSLYCLSKRQQAWDHMTIGGISVTPIQTTAKIEKAKDMFKGKLETPQTVVLTYEDVQKITKELSKEQKEVADQLQELMVKDMAALGNEAHLAMYGYEAFNEENYFPIKVAGNEKDFDVNKMGDVIEKIKSFGPAKPITPGARNKLIIDDIFSVVADHCNGMNLYNAYLVPISDFIKVYNYKGSYGEEGQERDNVKDAIERAYTKKALKYIENLLQDLNGIKQKSRGGLEDVLNTTLGRAKKAAVFGNIRVALQQPTAIVRAWAEMDLKYLTAGLKPQRGAMEEMRKYAPIARWKGWGYYDTYMGRDIEDVMMGTNETVSDTLLAGIYGYLDNLTWTAIWNGVKAETAEKRKDLKVGSEEFLRYCGERASEIFDKTQVVDSAFHRSDAMRSKQIIVKSLTAFQSEPTLTFNVFRAGMAKAIDEFKNGDKVTATKTFNRTVEVIVAQAILVSFAQALADAWRGKNPELPWDDDDDDDKKEPGYMERVWRNMVANFFDNVHLWNNIYLVKEVTPVMDYMFTKVGEHMIAKSGTESDWPKVLMFAMGWDKTSYYQSSNLLFQGLDTFATGFGQFMKKIEKGDDYDKSWYDIIQKEAGGIGYVTGFPLSTLMRDTKPLWDRLFASAFAAEEDEQDLLVSNVMNNGTAGTGTGTGKTTSTKKKSKKKSKAKGTEEQEEVFDYEKTAEKAKKAAESTSGAKRNDKLWDTVSDGYTAYLDKGDWDHIDKIRDIYTGAGGDPRVFDTKVLNHVKSSYKKTINTEFTLGDMEKQRKMKDYMLEHGVTEADISQMCYESYTAKDLKAALRMGNQEYIIEELLPLVAAGLTLEDFERLYENRNRGAKTYTGKYSDPKYKASTGSYRWPASGPITSGFGYRSAPTAGASSNHLGIDIGASMGSPVQAADGGTIIYVGYNGGYGNQVVVRHDDGTETYYSHMLGYNVNVGDKVMQGQQIGQVGSTGTSTGPHLDFRVKINGEFVNPMEYLKG